MNRDPERIVARQIENCAERGRHAPQLMLSANQMGAF